MYAKRTGEENKLDALEPVSLPTENQCLWVFVATLFILMYFDAIL
jgi:hypothetical protein